LLNGGWVHEKSRSSFTIGSQLQDGDCSYGRLLLPTQPRVLTQKGKQGPITLIKQYNIKDGSGGGRA